MVSVSEHLHCTLTNTAFIQLTGITAGSGGYWPSRLEAFIVMEYKSCKNQKGSPLMYKPRPQCDISLPDEEIINVNL